MTTKEKNKLWKEYIKQLKLKEHSDYRLINRLEEYLGLNQQYRVKKTGKRKKS